MLTLLFIGIGFIVGGYLVWQRNSHLIRHGKKTKAIIFKNEIEQSSGGPSYYPVVRFLTERNEWITQKLNTGYSPPKEEGERVEVLYDPLDPTIVEINSNFTLRIMPQVFIAIGAVLLLISIITSLV